MSGKCSLMYHIGDSLSPFADLLGRARASTMTSGGS